MLARDLGRASASVPRLRRTVAGVTVEEVNPIPVPKLASPRLKATIAPPSNHVPYFHHYPLMVIITTRVIVWYIWEHNTSSRRFHSIMTN